jgi:hypothetical protein
MLPLHVTTRSVCLHGKKQAVPGVLSVYSLSIHANATVDDNLLSSVNNCNTLPHHKLQLLTPALGRHMIQWLHPNSSTLVAQSVSSLLLSGVGPHSSVTAAAGAAAAVASHKTPYSADATSCCMHAAPWYILDCGTLAFRHPTSSCCAAW